MCQGHWPHVSPIYTPVSTTSSVLREHVDASKCLSNCQRLNILVTAHKGQVVDFFALLCFLAKSPQYPIITENIFYNLSTIYSNFWILISASFESGIPSQYYKDNFISFIVCFSLDTHLVWTDSVKYLWLWPRHVWRQHSLSALHEKSWFLCLVPFEKYRFLPKCYIV